MISNKFNALKTVKWGDIEDDDVLNTLSPISENNNEDDNQIINDLVEKNEKNPETTVSNKLKDVEENKAESETIENNKKIKTYDNSLNNKNEIIIMYNSKFFDKKNNKFVNTLRKRKLKIVSKSVYESLKHTINKCHPHKKKFLDIDEQNEKIRLTNNFMNLAYKDQSTSLTFVYPVVILHIKEKNLIKNNIHKESKCDFSISDIYYKFDVNGNVVNKDNNSNEKK